MRSARTEICINSYLSWSRIKCNTKRVVVFVPGGAFVEEPLPRHVDLSGRRRRPLLDVVVAKGHLLLALLLWRWGSRLFRLNAAQRDVLRVEAPHAADVRGGDRGVDGEVDHATSVFKY